MVVGLGLGDDVGVEGCLELRQEGLGEARADLTHRLELLRLGVRGRAGSQAGWDLNDALIQTPEMANCW